jgi:tetratricopeptide (TPR) repeat protein
MDTSPRPSEASADRLDWFLAGCALVLAFLASSFLVDKSDFWRHLAAGRLLAEDGFGVGSFAPATAGRSAWGFDLLLYVLYGSIGGAGLVLLKALLMTGLAWLLLQISQINGKVWPAAVCTMLGIVAMSPELHLRPEVLSIAFLGLTFWLLWLPHSGRCERYRDRTRLAGLLVLFVLWVNLDGWFWIGPLLVALFWLGERLPGNRGSTPNTPGWLVLAAIAVCTLNPHHWHVLVPFAGSPQDGGLMSPWRRSWQPLREINLAVWAYFVLVALGLLSFTVNRAHIVGWRILVWIAFFLVGAWQVRAVPYFAVVAAPITTLNLQDYFGRRAPSAGRWALVGRVALVVMSLGLIGLAYPGWLQGFKDDSRRVAWGVRPDPSLQQVAETVRDWRTRGILRDEDCALVIDRDVTNYLAWFCPQAKTVFRERSEEGRPSKAVVGFEDFRNSDFNYAIVAEPASFRLLHQPGRWALLHVDGRAAILGWRKEAGCRRPVDVPALDANRLADSGLAGVPSQGPRRDPDPPDLWTRLRKPIRPPTLESEAAGTYLRQFRAEKLPQQQQHASNRWAAYAAGLTGAPASRTSCLGVAAGLVDPQRLLGDLDGDLPVLPLVTVRLCRTALAANPDDVAAHVRLGQAYLALDRLSGERSGGKVLPLLVELRHVQIVTALEQALIGDPDQETAHQILANVYIERGQIDAALLHRREELRLVRRSSAKRLEEAASLAVQVGQLEQAVQNARKAWGISARARTTTDPIADADAAIRLGLVRAALDEVLLPAPQELLGSKGVRMECLLALQLGRAEQLRGLLLSPEARANRPNLGHVEILSPRGEGGPAGQLPA